MRAIEFVIFLFAMMFTWASCDNQNSLFGGSISQGTIEYAVSFPNMDADNVMASIMPNKMSVFFKDNKYSSEFNTYGGVFKNRVTIDTDKREYSQMLKIFKKRLLCQYDRVDIDEMMQDFPPFTIIESGLRDTLAGIPCRIAKGVFYDIEAEDIDIYYTDRIKIDNPNWGTPFSDLDGFLLGYDVDMFDIRMRLMAQEVKEEQVHDEDFNIEDTYKLVSYKYMKVEIEKLIESFDI
jgi:hypothetical protein